MAEGSQKLITFQLFRKLPVDDEDLASTHAFVANLDLSAPVEKITFRGPIVLDPVSKDRAKFFIGTAAYDRIEQKIYFHCWGKRSTPLPIDSYHSLWGLETFSPKIWHIDKYLTLSSSEEAACTFGNTHVDADDRPIMTGAILSSKSMAISTVSRNTSKRYQPHIVRKGSDGQWTSTRIQTANGNGVPSDAGSGRFVGVPAEDPTYVHFICSSTDSWISSLDLYSLKATSLPNLASDESIIWQQFKISTEATGNFRTLAVYDGKSFRYKLYIFDRRNIGTLSVSYVNLRKDGSVDSLNPDLKLQELRYFQLPDVGYTWTLKDAFVWEDRRRDSRKVMLLVNSKINNKDSDFAYVGDINADGSFAAERNWRLIPMEFPEEPSKGYYSDRNSASSVIVESEYV